MHHSSDSVRGAGTGLNDPADPVDHREGRSIRSCGQLHRIEVSSCLIGEHDIGDGSSESMPIEMGKPPLR